LPGAFGDFWAIGFSRDGNTVFTGTNHGEFKSTDKGASWTQISGLSATGRDFATADDGTIFLASDLGAHRSTDNGATWTDLNSGLPDTVPKSRCLRIGPDGYLYLGNKAGLFRSVQPVNGAVGIAEKVKVVGMQLQASPNPFKSAVSFELRAVSKGKIPDLYIYNVLGKCVARLTARRSSLTASYSWNAANMPAGIYVVRLQDGPRKITKQILLMK
jgi:hypothetical protein